MHVSHPQGKSHERLFVEKSIDEEEVIKVLQRFLYMGITSIAVVFIHSYTYPAHEQTVRRIAESMYVCMYLCMYTLVCIVVCTNNHYYYCYHHHYY